MTRFDARKYPLDQARLTRENTERIPARAVLNRRLRPGLALQRLRKKDDDYHAK
jgi:hypothetical protein